MQKVTSTVQEREREREREREVEREVEIYGYVESGECGVECVHECGPDAEVVLGECVGGEDGDERRVPQHGGEELAVHTHRVGTDHGGQG